MNSNKITKEVNGFEYEVDRKFPDSVFHLPRNRKDRLSLLRRFVFSKLDDRWSKLPKQYTTLEKEFVKQLFDSVA